MKDDEDHHAQCCGRSELGFAVEIGQSRLARRLTRFLRGAQDCRHDEPGVGATQHAQGTSVAKETVVIFLDWLLDGRVTPGMCLRAPWR
jgi:hypothetical protein